MYSLQSRFAAASRQTFRWLAGAAIGGATTTLVFGATVTLSPDADTMISERYPANNFGAMSGFNSGTTQNSNYNRGLLRFDLATALPAGAKIQSGQLTLEIIRNPDEPFPQARFNLHRMMVPWGEGRGTNGPGPGLGKGSIAFTNEATWTHRFAFTPQTWAQPGAGLATDYVATVTSFKTVEGVDSSPYTFPNTTQMIADLQSWLDHPETNFGWGVVCSREDLIFTARQFGSRENPGFEPRLEIQYLVPPRLAVSRLSGTELQLSFPALAEHGYEIQTRTNLALGSWTVWTNLPAAPADYPALLVDSLSAGPKFYRARVY
jgi:hypothetical protein